MYNYDKDIPGPGKYNPNIDYVLKRTSKRYLNNLYSVTFRGRIEYPIGGRDIPGPGQYELQSTLINSGNKGTIGRSIRHNEIRDIIGPGPGAYNTTVKFYHNIGPTFGKGEKSVGIKRSVTPGPGTYNPRTTVGTEGRKHSFYSKRPDTSSKLGQSSPGPAAYTFSYRTNSPAYSLGRDRHSKQKIMIGPSPTEYDPNYGLTRPSSPYWKMNRGSRNTSMAKRGMPEPGSYNVPTTIGKGPKIAFHGRLGKEKVSTIPGPGAYDPNPKAIQERYPKIVLSTGPRTEKDFSTRRDIPGPGTYPLKSTLTGPKFGFGIGKKGEQRNDDTPGPGTYKVPCTLGKAESYQFSPNKSQYSFV